MQHNLFCNRHNEVINGRLSLSSRICPSYSPFKTSQFSIVAKQMLTLRHKTSCLYNNSTPDGSAMDFVAVAKTCCKTALKSWQPMIRFSTLMPNFEKINNLNFLQL